MKRLLSSALLCAGLALSSSVTQAQQADSRDYELGYFAPNNSVAINVYGRQTAFEAPRNGSATTGILRATHLIKKGDWVFVPFDFLLPMTNLRIHTPTTVVLTPPAAGSTTPGAAGANLTLNTTGIGDLIWVPTIGTGLLQDPKIHTHTWFALTPYVTAPTGSYNTKRITGTNIGNNRWEFRPQLVVGQRFMKAFTVEAFGNIAFYTKNDEYRLGTDKIREAATAGIAPASVSGRNLELSQKMGYAAAVLTGIDLSPTFTVSANYYFSRNGKQTADLGGNFDEFLIQGKQTIHTLRVGMGIRVKEATQLLFQFNHDLHTENAPITKGFFVRVTHLFFPPPPPPQARPQVEGAPAGSVPPPAR